MTDSTNTLPAVQVPHNLGASSDTSLVTAIMRTEIDIQISTARKYPRSIHSAIQNITTLATLDEETAAECLYALVRGGGKKSNDDADSRQNKAIEGPSIRLAEIASQCWGNCRTDARVISVNREEKYVEAVGTFHDLETNMASSASVRRRISTKNGYLFSDDMIIVTGNAACAIAKRNAILAGIPKGIYRPAYQNARGVVAGTVKTLVENRSRAIKAFASFGVNAKQIFELLGVEGEGDITLEYVATLRAMYSTIKNGEATVEEMFSKPRPDGDPTYNPLVDKAERAAAEKKTDAGQTASQAASTETEVQRDPADSSAQSSSSGDEPQASDKGSSTDDSGQTEGTINSSQSGHQIAGDGNTGSSSSSPSDGDDRGPADGGSDSATGEGRPFPGYRDYAEKLQRATAEKSLKEFNNQYRNKNAWTTEPEHKKMLDDIYELHQKRVTNMIPPKAFADTMKRILA